MCAASLDDRADALRRYCVQSLWTMSRENLNVLIVIIDNGAYAILQGEMSRMASAPMGPAATDVFDITRPAIDFVKISEGAPLVPRLARRWLSRILVCVHAGMGVPATIATTAEEFHEQVAVAMAVTGPRLIQMCISGSSFL